MPTLYIDVLSKAAMAGPTDPTLPPVPDIRAPAVYPFTIYFLKKNTTTGLYEYQNYPSAVVVLELRQAGAPAYCRFSLSYQGYETTPIDASFSNSVIQSALETLPNIGVGNVSVTGDVRQGWTIEFIGKLAGVAIPLLTSRLISSTPAAEISVTNIPTETPSFGGIVAPIIFLPSTPNTKELVKLRCAPLATGTLWTVITGATPGWSCTLDTTSVPVSVWNNPNDDIRLEVKLTSQNARSGVDGVTVGDGLAVSGTGGAILASKGNTAGTARPTASGWLVAADSAGTYGTLFSQADVGRTVSDAGGGVIAAGTTILSVTTGTTNAAELSQPFTTATLPPTLTYVTGDLPSNVFSVPTGGQGFLATHVGHIITGDNIPANTQIVNVSSVTTVTLSANGTAIGGNNWAVAAQISDVFNAPSGGFTSVDVGATLQSPALPANTVTTQVIDATHVKLSKRPLSIGTGLSWTLLPARGFPAPAVSTVTAGSLSNGAVQRISLSTPPVTGKITIQDGRGGSMPVIEIPTPVSAASIQAQLAANYPNYGNVLVTERTPGLEYDVQFGAPGRQPPLVIDDSQVSYNATVMGMVLQPKGPMLPLPKPPDFFTTQVGDIWYMNWDTIQKFIGPPRITQLTDGTKALMYRQAVLGLTANFRPMGFDVSWTFEGKTYWSIGEQNYQDVPGGMAKWDVCGVTVPVTRVEKAQQMRPCIGVLKTYRGALLIDIQLYSLSISTWSMLAYWYAKGNANLHAIPDGPAGTVVHFINGVAALLPFNGFDATNGTFFQHFYQSYSIRRWMGDIWEVVAVWN